MTASLRVMTANLLFERAGSDHLVDLLDRVKPDVLVAQELRPEAAEVIVDWFPSHYVQPSTDFIGRGVGTVHVAEFGDIPMPNRDGSWALIEVEGRLVRVVGMHLANPIIFPWWRAARFRSQQLDALFTWTEAGDGDMPLVVAGDMNAGPIWPAYRRMADRWDDLASGGAASSEAKAERTWALRPGWPRMLRIDHVFGAGVEPMAAWAEPIHGSDHYAVVVDLSL